MFPTHLHLDINVNQFFVNLQRLPVFVWRFWIMRDDADDRRELIDANLPDVQVGDFGITVFLDALTNYLRQIRAYWNAIQKN